MSLRYKIELDDVEGHKLRWGEDLTGQEVTIRTESDDEVEGHTARVESVDMTGDDTEGHMPLRYRVELEVDDAQAHLLQMASDKGEPIHVRFPDDAEVKGHLWRIK
jgi:hypothetical protein